MITERELLKAIAECEAEPVTAAKIGKLADFYIIYDHLFGEPIESGYSSENKVETVIQTNGDTEFLQAVNGQNADKIWSIIAELLEALKATNPRLYNSVIRKITE